MSISQAPKSIHTADDGTTNQSVPPSPSGAAPVTRRREHLRFDKVFSVRVESLLFGDMICVARNISAGGLFLEVSDPLPLGATLRVCFPVHTRQMRHIVHLHVSIGFIVEVPTRS